MTSTATRRRHEKWLQEITVIPTAAGREQRVMAWIRRWVTARKNLTMTADQAGNLLIHQRSRSGKVPIWITAHLDHPAFVVTEIIDDRHLKMEFRGGVHDPYFEAAPLELFDSRNRVIKGKITHLDAKATPFKTVTVKTTASTMPLVLGDIGRWRFPGSLPRTRGDRFHTHACDDLAAVAAALATLDQLRGVRGMGHVSLLLTRAEEIGFIGTLAACADRTPPLNARLLCLENSRSFPESPIGGGPILRVGDRVTVFDPQLTNRIAEVLRAHEAEDPSFTWQRKLMPGGACEATAFSIYGWQSTCLCLPLGNYHNMGDIDGVAAGHRPAKVRPETISLRDYHGLITMLHTICTGLDRNDIPPYRARLDQLLKDRAWVLDQPTQHLQD
jgi:putative aminopeptidase FrvX